MLNIAKINLNILTQNALEIKSKLDQNVKLCAVVKADAYGHGAARVANCLYPIVDCFAVALIEEGIELRNSGIDKDVLVLTPVTSVDIEKAVRYGLTLTVESKRLLSAIDRESKRQGKRTKVHLKFNSGMNRFGVDLEGLKELLELAREKKNVILEGMYSHLACPQNKKSLKSAENKFLLANKLVKGYNNKAVCHLSASGGLLMGRRYDMVRVGILLYGYKPFECSNIKVKPVMKVYSSVIKSRNLLPKENALYGNYKIKQPTKVNIIRFGYADGLPRTAVKGQVNNRCMDVSMVTATKKSSGAVVMDNALALAKEYKTIPYEILTKIGLRAEKIYVN